MEKVIQRINEMHPISESDLKKMLEQCEIKEYSPKYKLVKLNQKTNHFYFLISGIIRIYTISTNGKKANLSLFFENSFFSSFSSLITKTPSKIAIECLTDCKVAKCNYPEFIKLTEKHIGLNILYRKSLEYLFLFLERNDIEFATLTATERYLELKNRLPNINNLISQKNIASHLGITPVQLSRLKKKLLTA